MKAFQFLFLLLLVISVPVVNAKQPWEKDWIEWNRKDAEKILADGRWSKNKASANWLALGLMRDIAQNSNATTNYYRAQANFITPTFAKAIAKSTQLRKRKSQIMADSLFKYIIDVTC